VKVNLIFTGYKTTFLQEITNDPILLNYPTDNLYICFNSDPDSKNIYLNPAWNIALFKLCNNVEKTS